MFDFSGMGERTFEHLCQTVACHVLGVGFLPTGEGRDGGRDGVFDGTVTFPDDGTTWTGYGVLQVKYMNGHPDTATGTNWLKRQIRIELEEWLAPDKDRVLYGQLPEYMIFASNVTLSPVPGRGGFDTVNALIAEYQSRIGLKGWKVWDHRTICTFISTSASIRDAFGLSTQGDVLASLNRLLTRPPSVGEGTPWCQSGFQQAFQACGGADTLGDPLGVAYEHGPGYAQHFLHKETGRRWVLCLLGNGPGVAVPAAIWDTICGLGIPGATTSGPFGAGYPIAPDGNPAAYLSDDRDQVLLRAGLWDDGMLIRGEHGWTWRPETKLSTTATRDKTTWTGGLSSMDIRLRLAARCHVVSEGLSINRAGHQRLAASLTTNPLAQFASRWASTRGIRTANPSWTVADEAAGRNDIGNAAYQLSYLQRDDQKPAVMLVLRVGLPDEIRPYLSLIADLRIDFSAVMPGLPLTYPTRVPDKLRVTVADLHGFMCSAWSTLRSGLAVITPVPELIAPAGPSTIEFHISSERPELIANTRSVMLDDVLNLTEFGPGTRRLPNDLSVAINGTMLLSGEEINQMSAQTLHYLANAYGFISADDSLLSLCARSTG